MLRVERSVKRDLCGPTLHSRWPLRPYVKSSDVSTNACVRCVTTALLAGEYV